MKKLVVNIFTVLFIVSFIIAIPVSIIKNHIQKSIDNMTLDMTYMSKTDHNVKIKFTENKGDTPEGYANTYDRYIAYFYVDGKEYYGIYKFDLIDKMNKIIRMNFYESDFQEARGVYVEFDINKKELSVRESLYYKNGFSDEGVFEENQIFIKKTWWTTWGKKFIVVLVTLFAIWRFKDVPKMLKDKEVKDDIKDNLKKRVNNFVDDLKKSFNNENHTDKL